MNKFLSFLFIVFSFVSINLVQASLIPLGDHNDLGDSITSEDPTVLDRRIADLDQKIREREKIALPEDPELKRMVEEYNQAVQMKAKKIESFHDQSEKITSLEKRIEQLEAIIAERRIGPKDESVKDVESKDSSENKKHAVDNIATQTVQELSKSSITSDTTVSQDYNLGLKLLGSENPEDHKKALSIFEEIMNKDPDSKLAHSSHINAGLASLALKDAVKAQSYFKSAIVLPLEDTQVITARLGYARSLQVNNQKEECCDQIKLMSKFAFTDIQKQEYEHLKSVCCSH